MDVVRVCSALDEMIVKPQHDRAQQPAAGRSRELYGSKRNKISRGAAQSADKRPAPNVGRQAYLEGPLRAVLAESTPSAADAARANACLEELRALVMKVGPEWSLEPFGSLASRFSTSCSDVDATCFEAGGKTWEAPDAARFLRDKVMPLIRGHPRLTVTEEVFNAKVPILRLSFDGQVDIDLSCQNTQALRNTRYLRAYAGLDPRVRDLGVAVKLWAKGAGVCGAAKGHLSSYTFTLLAIYFMQVAPDVLLPCLPTLAFEEGMAGEEDSKVRDLRSSWCCDLGLADLLWCFFLFYAREFFWGHEVVSPRLGSRLFARDARFARLRGRWATRLHVEDPFKLERNLHHVLGDLQEARLIGAMQQALYSLQIGVLPVGLQRAQQQRGIELSVKGPAVQEAQHGRRSADSGATAPAAQETAAPSRVTEEPTDSLRDSGSGACSAGRAPAAQEAAAPSRTAEEPSDSPRGSGSGPCGAGRGAASTAGKEPAAPEAAAPSQSAEEVSSCPGGSGSGACGAESGEASAAGKEPNDSPRDSRSGTCSTASGAACAAAAAARAGAPDLIDSPRGSGSRTCSTESGAACTASAANAGVLQPHAGGPTRQRHCEAGGERSDRWREDGGRAGSAGLAPRQPVCLTVRDLESRMGRDDPAPRRGPANRQPICLTVQDLEDKMGRGPGTTAPAALPARPFAAFATNKIQSRVSRACQAQRS